MKRCSRCGQSKSVDEFPRAGKRGRQAYCRPCAAAYERARRRIKRGLVPTDPLPSRAMPDGYTYGHRGYVMEKRMGHHRADRFGYVPQHILVMEAHTGWVITRDFTIHHRDGVRSNNDPSNLELRIGPHGKGADAVPGMVAILESLGFTVAWPGDKANLK